MLSDRELFAQFLAAAITHVNYSSVCDADDMLNKAAIIATKAMEELEYHYPAVAPCSPGLKPYRPS